MKNYLNIIRCFTPTKLRNKSIIELEKIPVSNWARMYCEFNSGEIPNELSHIKPKDWPDDPYGDDFKENAERMCKFLSPLMDRIENEIGRKACLRQGNIDRMTDEEFEYFWETGQHPPSYDKSSQYLFFINCRWKITAGGIQELKLTEAWEAWKEEVIQHKVSKKEAPFNISFNKEENEYEISITNADSNFFRFLINASRIHWKAEYIIRALGSEDENRKYIKDNRWNIAGKRLEYEEAWEQKQHLINKIFSIGYLLHRYKDPGRPWCVFAMDNKITESGESHGRSGKSLCYRTIRYFMKSVTLNGRKPKLTKNPHIYDRVTEHTDYILVDDADQYLNFGFFFNALHGDMEVNPKNNQSYEIPFEHVPKFCITSNFTLRNIDPSTEGRILLYTVFSDYYHVRTEGEDYAEDFTIRDDFDKNLFLDYNEDEWNDDFNFFASCLQFYLSVPRETKINPPMDNVTKRNLHRS